MQPFTLDRTFHKKDLIDEFSSIIWTERYYGDSEVELVVPATQNMIDKLPVGIFLGIENSDEVMIIETVEIDQKKLKVKGNSLLKWLNNRPLRTSAAHEDRYWYLSDQSPGQMLWVLIYYMCVEGSPFLDGTYDIGIPNPEKFIIPGLELLSYDSSDGNISIGVPFGPLYDALYELATTYEIGMRITLGSVTDTDYVLSFQSYKGLDRTSSQSVNAPVRFSPGMDSFANIKELISIVGFKTEVYAFAPSNPGGLATTPGISVLTNNQYSGFDLRALMIFADDITTDQVGSSAENLLNVLNGRAHDALMNSPFVAVVDGEVVSESQLKYGIHYNLGDIIEVQGNSGIVNVARVTEYIRSHDATGEKNYPTVSVIA